MNLQSLPDYGAKVGKVQRRSHPRSGEDGDGGRGKYWMTWWFGGKVAIQSYDLLAEIGLGGLPDWTGDYQVPLELCSHAYAAIWLLIMSDNCSRGAAVVMPTVWLVLCMLCR